MSVYLIRSSYARSQLQRLETKEAGMILRAVELLSVRCFRTGVCATPDRAGPIRIGCAWNAE